MKSQRRRKNIHRVQKKKREKKRNGWGETDGRKMAGKTNELQWLRATKKWAAHGTDIKPFGFILYYLIFFKTYLSIYLLVLKLIYLSFNRFICLSLSMDRPIYLPTYRIIHLFIPLSIHPSI